MTFLKDKNAVSETRYLADYSSPLGRIYLLSDGEMLTALWFEGQNHAPVLSGNEQTTNLPPVIDEAKAWLDSYFNGQKPTLFPDIRMQGTHFQQRVWHQLMHIPYGSTVTYGSIAARMRKEMGVSAVSARAVGAAVGRNPISIIVPCHRVIGSTGKLTGYAGGLPRKEWLLRFEGALPPLPGIDC